MLLGLGSNKLSNQRNDDAASQWLARELLGSLCDTRVDRIPRDENSARRRPPAPHFREKLGAALAA